MKDNYKLEDLSLKDRLALPEFEKAKDKWLSNLQQKFPSKATLKSHMASLAYNWDFIGRPKQQTPIPNDWFIWLLRAGRGFGKTKCGAEWIKQKEAEARAAGLQVEMGLVGDIYDDIEKAQVGEIIKCYAPKDPNRPSLCKGQLVWPGGSVAHLIQAEVPKKFRSKNLSFVWIDELAKFQYPEKVWDAVRLVTRIGQRPQIVITTTPGLHTNRLMTRIEKGEFGKCVLTTGSSYENTHLSEEYRNSIIKSYEGTRLGSQELYGNYIEALTGALWQNEMLQYVATDLLEKLPTFLRSTVVSVDPAITAHAKSNETGIMVAARDLNHLGYVLEDRSGKYSPDGWAEMAVSLYEKYDATCIVAEKNQGGDMVRSTIHNCNPKVKVELVQATKGKLVRAEPIARLYEQKKIFHARVFGDLEYQMLNFTGTPKNASYREVEEDNVIDSPDRLDAMVWAFTYLFSDKLRFFKPGVSSFRITSFG